MHRSTIAASATCLSKEATKASVSIINVSLLFKMQISTVFRRQTVRHLRKDSCRKDWLAETCRSHCQVCSSCFKSVVRLIYAKCISEEQMIHGPVACAHFINDCCVLKTLSSRQFLSSFCMTLSGKLKKATFKRIPFPSLSRCQTFIGVLTKTLSAWRHWRASPTSGTSVDNWFCYRVKHLVPVFLFPFVLSSIKMPDRQTISYYSASTVLHHRILRLRMRRRTRDGDKFFISCCRVAGNWVIIRQMTSDAEQCNSRLFLNSALRDTELTGGLCATFNTLLRTTPHYMHYSPAPNASRSCDGFEWINFRCQRVVVVVTGNRKPAPDITQYTRQMPPRVYV